MKKVLALLLMMMLTAGLAAPALASAANDGRNEALITGAPLWLREKLTRDRENPRQALGFGALFTEDEKAGLGYGFSSNSGPFLDNDEGQRLEVDPKPQTN